MDISSIIFKRGRGFTLIEIIIAAFIIIIIAGISIPLYIKSKEHLLGREAIASLKLISVGEKIYRMKNLAYVSCRCRDSGECGGNQGCNALLKTNLVTQNWAYEVRATGITFSATAARQGSGGYLNCVYTMADADDAPAGAGCP
ncbi:MAG: prepilin-type N-terminal cleavage/methylation domain-containing protein [Candidatus Omnitrophica bacterium]|nr:prepilin-type N-terminal cleavage/methylation domain-containing protein [Candidatus Omnitrophota bacterium]MBL7151609.1 prepilin-type N-terminal cleavage/methylation domain-containing protein [Candidatus Omnitrophota bacterium]